MRHATILLMTALLAGCGLAPVAPVARPQSVTAQRAPAELYPATPGLSWTYRTSQQVGEQAAKPGPDQHFWITTASADATSSSAVMERTFGGRPMAPTRIVRTADAVILSRHLRPEDGSLTVLRLPAVPGASWGGRTWPAAAETIQVLSEAPVTVPAGTYQAVRTEHHLRYTNGHEDLLQYWYAPGLGMVKAIEALTVDLGQGPTRYQVTAELVTLERPGR